MSILKPNIAKIIKKGDIERLLRIFEFKRGKSYWYEAANALEAFKDLRAVKPLIRLLRHNDSEIKACAASILGAIGDSEAVSPLISLLSDTDQSVRGKASKALGRIGDPAAVNSLIYSLNDRQNHVRMEAAKALGLIGDRGAVIPLIKLLNDRDSSVQESVVNALGRIGDERAIKPFTELLGKIRGVPLAFANIGEPAIEKLISIFSEDFHALRIDEKKIPLFADAVNSLGRIGNEKAVDIILHILKSSRRTLSYYSDHRFLIAESAEALGRIGNTEAVKELILSLSEEYRIFDRGLIAREKIVQALGRIGNPEAVEHIIRVNQWWTGARDELQSRAVIALGEIGDPAGIDYIVEALQNGWWEVRMFAAEALGRIGDPRATEHLINALHSLVRIEPWPNYSTAAIRWAASEALKCIRYPKHVKTTTDAFLNEPMVDRDTICAMFAGYKNDELPALGACFCFAGIRHQARQFYDLIIDQLDDEINYSWIKRMGDAKVLGTIGDETTIEYLGRSLHDLAEEVRASAAESLGRISSPKSIEFLIKNGLQDSKWLVRESAAEALGKIGDKNSVEFLHKALRDRNKKVRARAAQAVGRIGNPESLEPLFETLKDADVYVRLRAVEAFGRIGTEKAQNALKIALGDESRLVNRFAEIFLKTIDNTNMTK